MTLVRVACLTERWHFPSGTSSSSIGKEVSEIEKRRDNALVWDDVRAFLAVARTGTLSGAAENVVLGIATVSRRIHRLERALGVPLFTRQQSGYRLTEDGSALMERAEEMEAAARSLGSGIRDEAALSGVVRLATAENLATGLVLPALSELRTSYPNLTVELITNIATINIHRRDADLALRMVMPERGNVTVQRLGVLGYGLYCCSDYAAARGQREDRARFDADDFIGWGEGQAHLPAARWVQRALRGRAPALTTTSLGAQVVACAEGLGLAVLPHFLAKPRGLICLDADLGLDQSIFLVIHADLAQLRRIRATADFLRELVARHRDALGGRSNLTH